MKKKTIIVPIMLATLAILTGCNNNSVTTYTITFHTNGGTYVPNQVVANGKLASEPTAPERTGYKFNGWYEDTNLTKKYNFATPVAKAFTLYAGWVNAN